MKKMLCGNTLGVKIGVEVSDPLNAFWLKSSPATGFGPIGFVETPAEFVKLSTAYPAGCSRNRFRSSRAPPYSSAGSSDAQPRTEIVQVFIVKASKRRASHHGQVSIGIEAGEKVVFRRENPEVFPAQSRVDRKVSSNSPVILREKSKPVVVCVPLRVALVGFHERVAEVDWLNTSTTGSFEIPQLQGLKEKRPRSKLSLKLLTAMWRTSPPNFHVWRPRIHVKLSSN